ncbi:MAG: hypothetical protein Tsb0016_15410 [Sphingomonadales bacterium]
MQIPLWWTVMLSLAVYLGSLDKNLTAALVFALVFGIVFGGGMMAMKKPGRSLQRPRFYGPRRPAKARRLAPR